MTARERRSASAHCKENIFSFQRCHKSLLDCCAVAGPLTRQRPQSGQAAGSFPTWGGGGHVRAKVARSSSPCCASSATLRFLLNLACVPLMQQLPEGDLIHRRRSLSARCSNEASHYSPVGPSPPRPSPCWCASSLHI